MAPRLASPIHKNSRWAGIRLHGIGLSILTVHLTRNQDWPVWEDEQETERRDGRADGLADEADVHRTLADSLANHNLHVADLVCTDCGSHEWRNTEQATTYRSQYIDLSDPSAPQGWRGDADFSDLDWEGADDRWECQNCGTSPHHRVEAVLNDVFFAVA